MSIFSNARMIKPCNKPIEAAEGTIPKNIESNWNKSWSYMYSKIFDGGLDDAPVFSPVVMGEFVTEELIPTFQERLNRINEPPGQGITYYSGGGTIISMDTGGTPSVNTPRQGTSDGYQGNRNGDYFPPSSNIL